MANARPLRAFNKRALSTILAAALIATVLAIAPASTAAQSQNIAPFARAGADRVAPLGARILSVDASGSFDPDGSASALTYEWEVVTPSYVNFIFITPTGSPSGITADFLPPSPSEAAVRGYSVTFRLTVTDPQGATGTDRITFRFEGPPTAGIDVTAFLPDPNAVDTDRSGFIEDDERYTIPAVIRRPGQGGNNQIEWTVREGALLTLKAIAAPGVGGSDASTLTYYWQRRSSVPPYSEFTIPVANRDDQEFSRLLPSALRQNQTAIVHYSLTVTGASGSQTVVTVRINVVDEPFAPEVELTLANTRQPVQDANASNPDSPTLNYVVRPGAAVQLIARGSDNDAGESTQLTHTWSTTAVTPNTSNPNRGTTSRATFTAPANATDGQTFVVTITVTDPSRRTGRDAIVFTVVDNNRAPVATAPGHTVAEDGPRGGTNRQGLVILTGTGTDPDNDPLSYRWAQVDANGVPLEEPTLELINANTATVSFTPPDVAGFGELEVYLSFTAIDQWGVSDTDTVTVTVLGQNLKPEADAGPNQTVLPGAFVQLDGTGSTDPDTGRRLAAWEWRQTGFETTPPQSVRPMTRFEELTLAGFFPLSGNFINFLTGPNSPTPYFDAPTDIGGYTSVQLTFTLTVTDGSRSTDTDTVTISVISRYFSGVVTSPDFCTNLSLGGPPTYPHDIDGDGVADQCSLRTTRREAVARQNALQHLASLNAIQFKSQVLAACNRVTADFGDDPAKLAKDACATSAVSDPPDPVPPHLAATFFSGPVVTGPDFCTNYSLGGARLYAYDVPPRDGVADICVLPYTRREAVARQYALETFATPQSVFDSALALACRELGAAVFPGDRPDSLAEDACAS